MNPAAHLLPCVIDRSAALAGPGESKSASAVDRQAAAQKPEFQPITTLRFSQY